MLTIENTNICYGSSIALRGASLDIESDKMTCVMGRNDVGKTSQLRSIIGHHPLSFGKQTFSGEELTKKQFRDRGAVMRSKLSHTLDRNDVRAHLTV